MKNWAKILYFGKILESKIRYKELGGNFILT